MTDRSDILGAGKRLLAEASQSSEDSGPAIGCRQMKPETLFVHAGRKVDETGAWSPPIHLSTTFARDASNELVGPSSYIREGNPTQSLLEEALAVLEGGETALAFGSGMAAGAALLQTLEPGSHL